MCNAHCDRDGENDDGRIAGVEQPEQRERRKGAERCADQDIGRRPTLSDSQPNNGIVTNSTTAVLAAAGVLEGRVATTRRTRVGTETRAPLAVLSEPARGIRAVPAAIVDDVVVTGGGVSLAIDTTLYLIGKIYGVDVRNDVARITEYDRAFKANVDALGLVAPS
jgi:hypothetical protein